MEGWLLVHEDDDLRVVAAAGDQPGTLIGLTTPAGEGSAGFVVASGQPLALTGHGDERLRQGMAARIGRELSSVLSVPCVSNATVVGALELADKEGGEAFSFDDVELVTLLAGIAGVVMAQVTQRPDVPSPRDLAGELERLAAADPERYGAVAPVISALLSHG